MQGQNNRMRQILIIAGIVFAILAIVLSIIMNLVSFIIGGGIYLLFA